LCNKIHKNKELYLEHATTLESEGKLKVRLPEAYLKDGESVDTLITLEDAEIDFEEVDGNSGIKPANLINAKLFVKPKFMIRSSRYGNRFEDITHFSHWPAPNGKIMISWVSVAIDKADRTLAHFANQNTDPSFFKNGLSTLLFSEILKKQPQILKISAWLIGTNASTGGKPFDKMLSKFGFKIEKKYIKEESGLRKQIVEYSRKMPVPQPLRS
jgi:hypothetical protein